MEMRNRSSYQPVHRRGPRVFMQVPRWYSINNSYTSVKLKKDQLTARQHLPVSFCKAFKDCLKGSWSLLLKGGEIVYLFFTVPIYLWDRMDCLHGRQSWVGENERMDPVLGSKLLQQLRLSPLILQVVWSIMLWKHVAFYKNLGLFYLPRAALLWNVRSLSYGWVLT